MIEVKGLYKSFDDKTVLRNVSWGCLLRRRVKSCMTVEIS